MKKKGTILGVVIFLILAGIYYYLALPAFNIHSADVWYFILVLVAVVGIIYALKRGISRRKEISDSKFLKVIIGLFIVLLLVYLIGSFLSSPVINAKKYQQLLKVEDGEFTQDIEELSFDQIPLLDRDSAQILGNRKMGSMSDMVSQFEVDDIYSQINYKNRPVRVSPLRYASLIKWFTNRKEGIPAYIRIDMASQTTEMVKLDDRLRTRFEGGLLADVQPPDVETRMAIIRNKAAQFGMMLSDDVVKYIAENITSNVRQLEGVVKRLTAYRDILDDTITVDSVKRAIKDVIRTGAYIPTPEVIIEETARYYQLTGDDLRGQRRSKNTAMARQVSMYLMRNLTNLSLQDIGSEYGDRNHSTVLSSIRKVEDLLKSNPDMAGTVRDITSHINSKN